MANLTSTIGGGPIFISPGERGGFGYTSNGGGTGTLTFTPLGDGLTGSGNTTMSISTTGPNGPVDLNVPVSNSAPTQIDIPYGGSPDGGLGAGEVGIGNVPQIGADGNILPNLPLAGMIPGGKTAYGLANDVLQSSQMMNQKSFAVTMTARKKAVKEKPAVCDAKCQAAKQAAEEAAQQQLHDSFGDGP